MYFEIDFGDYAQVDEVRIETSRDSPAKPEVQIYDDSGPWVTVASNPSVNTVSPAANLRYAATRELALRGVRYLLVNDNDFGAADFRDNSESWGLSEVSQGYGVRLYRVLP
jgi:hypothetical protein